MSTQSTPLNLDIPNFGKVPVQVDQGRDGESFVTHRPPTVRASPLPNPLLNFLTDRVVPFNDPDPANKLPQYAIKQQKIVTLTEDQLKQLRGEAPDKKTLVVFTALGKGETATLDEKLASITTNPNAHVIPLDCPDLSTTGINGKATYTVLLDWLEVTKEDFPDVLLQDPGTGAITRIVSQTNNFLVISGMEDDGGDPHDPPPTPPISGVGPLNTQTTDFKIAIDADIQHYQQLNGQDKGPAVAVMDTGLKFNLHAEQWPDGSYAYRDADGQKQRFKLAYQDPSTTDCGGILTDNPIGYCALQSYRQDAFISRVMALPAGSDPSVHIPDVKKSPYDDYRLFDSSEETTIQEARHGTSVTAIIQQNGDNAPVLPIKAFDNMGFATLFDVLNGFNYVLNRHKSANIRVVNASWIFGRHEPLLEEKIRQLMEAGVFVVAAAGNERQTADRNIEVVKVYPACYSQTYPNVITVTSVRKTYLPVKFMSHGGDSIIGNLLSHAIGGLGLFKVLNQADNIIGEILPTAGYIAVENYSTTYVNVGVVSTFGYFRSPFQMGQPVRGSSYACAFVSGFVIRQLRTRPGVLSSGQPVSSDAMAEARQELLDAMSGRDGNLETDYVAGGYYLSGYDVD